MAETEELNEDLNEERFLENCNGTFENDPAIDSIDCTEINYQSTEDHQYFDELRNWMKEANMAQISHNYFMLWMLRMGMMMEAQIKTIRSQIQRNSLRSFSAQRMTHEMLRHQHRMPNNFRSTYISRLIYKLRCYFQNNRRHERIIYHSGGFEFTITPIWKRIVAEIFDMISLSTVMCIVVTVVHKWLNFELSAFGFDASYINKFLYDQEEDYGALVYGLIVLDFAFKPLVSFYEAFWTMDGSGAIGGATPGKLIMGIRIICTDTIVRRAPIQNRNHNCLTDSIEVLVIPVRNLGFRRAYVRAFSKNVLMFVLFPMSLLSFGLENNRSAHDYLVKTIVVENNYQGRARRRRLNQ